MASSIPPLPAVAAESASQNRNRVQAFTQNLANLSAGVRASGDSIRPVEAPPRVEPVPLAAEIRAELEKNEHHVLSIGLLKKFDEIEKITKRARTRVKR